MKLISNNAEICEFPLYERVVERLETEQLRGCVDQAECDAVTWGVVGFFLGGVTFSVIYLSIF